MNVLMNIGLRIELNLLKVTYFFDKIHDVQKILEIDTLSIEKGEEQTSPCYIYTIVQ